MGVCVLLRLFISSNKVCHTACTVLPGVCLFLCFSVVFSITIASLGVERANLSAFCTFVRFALVLVLSVSSSGKDCSL